MKIRFPLAAAAVAAAAGLASAQPVQVQVFQKIRPPVYDGPAEPTEPKKPENTEYKPPANTSPDPKSLEVPADLQKKAQELTAKLGSKVYSEREQATRELGKMGRMALPALYEAIGTATEMEVAQRAEGLLPKAEAEDMKAKVACFLSDTEGKFNHTLPGWEKFKAVAGNDKASRELFAEALKSKMTHEMLLAADKTSDEANSVLNQYMTKLQGGQYGRGGFDGGIGQPYQPKLADLVTALFLEGQFTDREVVIQPTLPWGWGGGGYYSVVNYVYNVPDVQNAIYNNQSGKYSSAIRKIMIQWMDTRVSAQGANQAYSFAQNMFNRPEDRKKQFKYAARVLEADGGPNTSYMKVNILTQFGQADRGAGKEFLPVIAKCFDDATLIWNWQNQNPAFDIQLRDYALAVAVQMADLKPEDFEMSRTPGHGSGKSWNQNAFYFKDDTPNKNPNGGIGRFPGRGGKFPVEPVEEPKKEEPKKDDPKDTKKDEPKKLSQDDRRKIAFKKWDEWVKTNVGVDASDKEADKTKKWEEWAKKDPKADPKKDQPKKDEPKPQDEPRKDQPDVIKKDVETIVAPAVLPKK